MFKSVQGEGYVKITKFERAYLMNGPEGVWFPQGIYKFLKVICQERRTSSIKVQLTPIQTWFVNIAIGNKRQNLWTCRDWIFPLILLTFSLKSWSYLYLISVKHVYICSPRMKSYLHDMIRWNTCPSNICNHGITCNKYFLLFSWQLSYVVFCCKVIIFSHYFICSCNLLGTISFTVISFFLVSLEFIAAIFLP